MRSQFLILDIDNKTPVIFFLSLIQHLDEGSGVQYIVTGCSNYVNNSTVHSGNVPSKSSKFFWAEYSKLGGFATMQATPVVMDMTFVDSTGKSLYSIAMKPRDTHF